MTVMEFFAVTSFIASVVLSVVVALVLALSNNRTKQLFGELTELSRKVGELKEGIRASAASPAYTVAGSIPFDAHTSASDHFMEKTFRRRSEKREICSKIVRDHIGSREHILLDSGSTVDLVTFELLTHQRFDVMVCSNSVPAAVHLAGTKSVHFQMLPGVFSDRFGAVYSDAALTVVRDGRFDVFILATTAIRFEQGVMVHSSDEQNGEFKRTVLEAFERYGNTRLIIAADVSKFSERVDEHKPVFERDRWRRLVTSHCKRIVIVSAAPLGDANVDTSFLIELGKFANAGVRIDPNITELRAMFVG